MCLEGTGYFAMNCKTREEAFELMQTDIAENMDAVTDYKAEQLKEVSISRCLDCDSLWTGDTCGDCGESRLSKRSFAAYFLECRMPPLP